MNVNYLDLVSSDLTFFQFSLDEWDHFSDLINLGKLLPEKEVLKSDWAHIQPNQVVDRKTLLPLVPFNSGIENGKMF